MSSAVAVSPFFLDTHCQPALAESAFARAAQLCYLYVAWKMLCQTVLSLNLLYNKDKFFEVRKRSDPSP
jgi:hypothetical protein